MIKYLLLLFLSFSAFAEFDSATKENIKVERATLLLCQEKYFTKTDQKKMKSLLKKYKILKGKEELSPKKRKLFIAIEKELTKLALWKKYYETTNKIYQSMKKSGYTEELEEFYNQRMAIEESFLKKTGKKFPPRFPVEVMKKVSKK